MKTDRPETRRHLEVDFDCPPRHAVRLAPLSLFASSVRVPCTAANRALLRDLRAAELAAWEGATRDRPTEPRS